METEQDTTQDILKELKQLPSSTLHEAAGRIGALPSQIKPVANHFKVCGYAFPVQSPPGDNLWLHRAIYKANPGDILVVNVGLGYEFGYWGEILTNAAIEQGLGGLIINGCVRDRDRLVELPFPIFSRGFCIRGTGKDKTAQGILNHSTQIDDVIINPGDLIVGDNDGVVVIPKDKILEVLEEAKLREEKEKAVILELKKGRSSLDIYNLG
jgi:4-hydroxy-4-methyl-2-oxoglutarate aldolase